MNEPTPVPSGPPAPDAEPVPGATAQPLRRTGPRLLVAVTGLLVVLGGTVFALSGSDDGPGSPEEAVAEFVRAVNDEDVLGVLASLDPGERDALAGPVREFFAELQRLEVLGPAFRLDDIAGVDIELTDLELRTEPIRDDLASVTIVSGVGELGYDTDDLPVGALLLDAFERFGFDHRGRSGSERAPFDDGGSLVTRRGPDGWRVSLGFTVAEAARKGSGQPVPDTGTGLTPAGADSPEAAVRATIEAAVDGDLSRLVAGLSPNEFAALQEYWSLVGWQDLDMASEGLAVRIESLDLRASTDGDRGRVFLEGLDVTVTADGEDLRLSWADGCYELTGSALELLDPADLGIDPALDPFAGPICPDDTGTTANPAAALDLLDQLGISLGDIPPVRTPELGVAVHRVDGAWYTAPLGTALDGAVELLRSIDRAHLDAIIAVAEQGFGLPGS